MKKMHILTMIIFTCMASFSPYLLFYAIPAINKTYLLVFGFLIWLILLIFTLKLGAWNKKLFWLFMLFPIAAGPFLLFLFLLFSFYLSGGPN